MGFLFGIGLQPMAFSLAKSFDIKTTCEETAFDLTDF